MEKSDNIKKLKGSLLISDKRLKVKWTVKVNFIKSKRDTG
jgi:hypothetical protein